MTVSTSVYKAGPYAGSGTTGPFTVNFRFLANSHLRVIKTSTTGSEATLTLGVDYSVTGAGDASGTVTLTSPLLTGEKLTIVRNVPLTQETDYVVDDSFPAESHEQALDKLTMIAQQLAEEVDRAVKVLPSSTDDPDALIASVRTSEQNAAASAASAAASYDLFDDRYLGSKTSNPTVDNDGNALQVGAEYWNSVSNERRTWTGSGWVSSITVVPDASVTVPKIETSVTARFGLLRNLLLNPSGGAVYQRNVAATADDVYFADRWYALTELGNATPSVLTDPEPGYPFGTRLTQSNATAQRFGFAQIIEGRNCKHLRGWSGVLGARVRASGSQTIRYAILAWTGTEDTVTSDIVNNWSSTSFTAGGFFISSNLSVLAVGSQAVTANTWTSLPDIFASMGTSFNNVIVMVWTESVQAQNFTLDWDWVQFERGSVLTPPDWRGTAELALCQRYYEQSYEPGAVGTATSVGALQNYNASGSVNTAALQVIFKVQKRATPTVTSYSTQSGASGQIRDQSGADRTATVQYVSTSGAHITNSAVGNAANYSAQWVAAIEL